MRLVLTMGKGGVGKTTTAAATAVVAAAGGCRTLVASADPAHSLGDVLECRLGSEPQAVAPCLDALEIDSRDVMNRHWGKIRDYLVAILRFQGLDEVVAEELALLPGAEEIATLLIVEEHLQSGRYDFVVVDCAPTGSTLRLLTLPDVARASLRVLLRVQRTLAGLVTPLARHLFAVPLPDAQVFRDVDQLFYKRLRRLHERVTGPDTSVRLVVTPERMVIDEARRSFTDLCLFQIPCDAVIMNRLLPQEASAERFFQDWGRLQVERRQEVEAIFSPLPVLAAPLQEDEVTGLAALGSHGRQVFGSLEPQAKLGHSPRIRFIRQKNGYGVELPLPHANADDLDVSKVDDELVVRCGGRRRSIKLPRRIALLELRAARFEDDRLLVQFGTEGSPCG